MTGNRKEDKERKGKEMIGNIKRKSKEMVKDNFQIGVGGKRKNQRRKEKTGKNKIRYFKRNENSKWHREGNRKRKKERKPCKKKRQRNEKGKIKQSSMKRDREKI